MLNSTISHYIKSKPCRIALALAATLVLAGLTFKDEEAQHETSACPAGLEEAFGHSFDDLRRDCFPKPSYTRMPALTCAQIRMLATRSNDGTWPEGQVAEFVRAKHCAFSADDTVSPDRKSELEVSNATILASVEFSQDSCPVEASVRIGDNRFSFTLSGSEYSGIIDDHNWLIGTSGNGRVVMGPMSEAEIHDPVCGMGILKLTAKEAM